MTQQSIEPKIANYINQQLSSYHLKYFLQQETVNTEIENALSRAASKSGGDGGNRVDCKLLLQDDLLNYYPVMIEYKGYADKLEKLNSDGPSTRKKVNQTTKTSTPTQ